MATIEWTEAGRYTDIEYHKAEGIAKITINRPEVRNAFRPLTVEEMIRTLDDARNDETVGVIILTGAGEKAFCSGGDRKIRGDSGYRDATGVHRLNVLEFRGLRRSGRTAGVGRQRHHALLHDRGRPGGEERLRGEAQAGLLEVPQTPLNPVRHGAGSR